MAQIQPSRIARKLSVLQRRYRLTKPKLIALGIAALVLLGGMGSVIVRSWPGGFLLGQSKAQSAQTIEASHLQKLAAQSDASSDAVTQASTAQAQTLDAVQSVVVHVDGAVAHPGVYTLTQAKPRIRDAVDLAGGIVEGADTSTINLAALVEDGSKVYIPKQGETAVVEQAASGGSHAGATSGDVQADNANSGERININTATEQELMSLPGVGKSTAQAIIDDRRTNGVFTSTEDLMRVSGIGSKKFAKLQGKIRV